MILVGFDHQMEELKEDGTIHLGPIRLTEELVAYDSLRHTHRLKRNQRFLFGYYLPLRGVVKLSDGYDTLYVPIKVVAQDAKVNGRILPPLPESRPAHIEMYGGF